MKITVGGKWKKKEVFFGKDILHWNKKNFQIMSHSTKCGINLENQTKFSLAYYPSISKNLTYVKSGQKRQKIIIFQDVD